MRKWNQILILVGLFLTLVGILTIIGTQLIHLSVDIGLIVVLIGFLLTVLGIMRSYQFE